MPNKQGGDEVLPGTALSLFPAGAMLGAGGTRCFISSSVSQQDCWPCTQVHPPPPQSQLSDLRQVPAASPSTQEAEGENRPSPTGQGPSRTGFHPGFEPASVQPSQLGTTLQV